MLLRIGRICGLLAGLLSLVGCGGDDIGAAASEFEWGAREYGDYYTGSCGDFAADHESSEWVSETTVVLTKASGCGVYHAEMDFSGDYWTTEMDICNRCTSQQYLTWAMYDDLYVTGRYLYYDEESNSLKEGSGDLDGMPGPDYGDGLTGLIRFKDTNQRESVNQCGFRFQVSSDYGDPQPVAKRIQQIPLPPGSSFTTKLSQPINHFMRDIWRAWDGAPADYSPVNYRSLERVEYLWPRLRNAGDRSVANFPEAYCEELGLSVIEKPLQNGTYDADPMQNKIPQAFELRVPDEILDRLVVWTVHNWYYLQDDSH